MADHRAEFSERLAAAMRQAGYEPKPGVLMKQFNSRFRGPSIRFQTASRWLRGKGVPKLDKLAVLADWLHVDRGLLGFGEKSRRASDRQIREDGASYEEDELIEGFRTLPAEHRKLVRELVDALKDTKSAKMHR
jgi:transcriptional regulator with XRE-family HTH domain